MNRAAFLIVLLLSSGCTVSDRTLTQQQATARVDQLIRDTAAALKPPPRLELIPHGTGAERCLTPGEPDGKITVNLAYWLRDIPKSENVNISQQVKAYWESQGHQITAVGKEGTPDLNAESTPDHYLLSLSWAVGDNLFLESTSTCVWPNGTAPAKSP